METISHLNLQIEGVPFTSIQGLEISHNINEHAIAVISGEIESETAQQYLQRTDEKMMIKIKTTAEGQPDILFWGMVEGIDIKNQNQYALLTVTAKSMSAQTDIEKRNKSFQNTGKHYEDILREVLGNQAVVCVEVTDQAIGNMIVQCNETNWEFCKRMASRLSAPVITSIHTKIPTFTIGVPGNGEIYELTSVERAAGTNGQKNSNQMAEDKMATGITTLQYVFLGDYVSYGSGSGKVMQIYSCLQGGVLRTTIHTATENGFKQAQIVNQQIAGKMYLAEVQAVRGDEVQVHLLDVDGSYDSSSSVWLPYSTAYSSADGSGFYCMPAKGDKVRVFFPAADEGQAFAASSVCVNPAARVTDKKWSGPNGKQILLTEDGIYITTNGSNRKIFIDLTDKAGITIKSNQNISICAKNNLSLISNNSIAINAEKDILISTAESYIDITPEGIELGANNVVIK